MSGNRTVNVRLGATLADFVNRNVGENGAYENVSEYVRDLIRRDKERVEAERFHIRKAELQRGFAAPDSEFIEIDPVEWLERAKSRNRG